MMPTKTLTHNLKAVILAGGKGTRLSEETYDKPKPIVTIGNKPILWHIMKVYSAYGINEFIICLGYKGNVIREFFNKASESNRNKKSLRHSMPIIPVDWKVTLADTGLNTMTGGRLKKVKKFLKEETFCFTYGDTLNNLNINELIKFHKKKKALTTVTACVPPEKYGVLKIRGGKVMDFREKLNHQKDWVNGGYFVLEPEVFDYIEGDDTMWEKKPMERLAREGHLFAYKHTGFYQMMDSLREKNYLNDLWKSGKAPWKIW